MTASPTPWTLRLLREGTWFKALPEPLQLEFVRRSTVRSYRRGQWVTRAGSRLDGLYGLLEGRLWAVRPVGEDREDLIHVAEPGFWIGEYSLLTGEPAVVGTRGTVLFDFIMRREQTYAVYLFVIIAPLLSSSHRRANVFGLLICLVVVVVYLFFRYAYISFFCIGGALMSLYIIHMIFAETSGRQAGDAAGPQRSVA